jgi:hypothetical protein
MVNLPNLSRTIQAKMPKTRPLTTPEIEGIIEADTILIDKATNPN